MLCALRIPLHDTVIEERFRLGSVGVDHSEPCLALGRLPYHGAQTHARQNGGSEAALEARHSLGVAREQQGNHVAHRYARTAHAVSDWALKAGLLGAKRYGAGKVAREARRLCFSVIYVNSYP